MLHENGPTKHIVDQLMVHFIKPQGNVAKWLNVLMQAVFCWNIAVIS